VQSAAVAALVVLIDQVTKFAIVERLTIGESLPVYRNLISFRHIRNTGAVFGIMRGAGSYFTVFSIVAAAILIIVLFVARKSSLFVKASLGLILGGAVGNLIDRLRYGNVVDFVDVGISGKLRWPCFNIADVAITVGVALLVINTLRKPETDNTG
jgi:signal peptidase II